MAVALFAACGGESVRAAFEEDWNSPAAGANSWYYFDPDAPPQGDVELTWRETGGIGNSGYVSCPLGELGLWDATPGSYYPLYAYGTDHPVNLVESPTVSVGLIDVDGESDLQGGTLRFWVGQWTSGNEYYFVYFNRDSLSVSDAWTTHDLFTTSDPGHWSVLGGQGTPPDLETLLSSPQQWGVTLVGASGAPQGELGFDNLRAVPEPGVLSLLPVMLLVLWRRRGP